MVSYTGKLPKQAPRRFSHDFHFAAVGRFQAACFKVKMLFCNGIL
jgi:hypothetical protein